MDFSSCAIEKKKYLKTRVGEGAASPVCFLEDLREMELSSSSHHGLEEQHTFDKLAVRSKTAPKWLCH